MVVVTDVANILVNMRRIFQGFIISHVLGMFPVCWVIMFSPCVIVCEISLSNTQKPAVHNMVSDGVERIAYFTLEQPLSNVFISWECNFELCPTLPQKNQLNNWLEGELLNYLFTSCSQALN